MTEGSFLQWHEGIAVLDSNAAKTACQLLETLTQATIFSSWAIEIGHQRRSQCLKRKCDMHKLRPQLKRQMRLQIASNGFSAALVI